MTPLSAAIQSRRRSSTQISANLRARSPAIKACLGITTESLAKLKPVKPNGTVTFGGQTHPADGNAGMIVTTKERAAELAQNKFIEVQLLGFGQARVEKGHMPMAPVSAARAALKAADLEMKISTP